MDLKIQYKAQILFNEQKVISIKKIFLIKFYNLKENQTAKLIIKINLYLLNLKSLSVIKFLFIRALYKFIGLENPIKSSDFIL